jgi:hypothetical protein
MDRKTTIGLVVIFALLGLYVAIVQKPQEQASTAATATAVAGKDIPLWDFPLDDVLAVRLDDLTQVRSVAFEKNAQGVWNVTQPTAGPGDVVLAERIVGDLRRLYIVSEFPEASDQIAFGLDKPLYRVHVELIGGRTLGLTLGAKTMTGNGYYAVAEGDSHVRVLNYVSVGDAIVTPLEAPPYFVTATPTAAAAQATVDLSRILPATILPPTGTPQP